MHAGPLRAGRRVWRRVGLDRGPAGSHEGPRRHDDRRPAGARGRLAWARTDVSHLTLDPRPRRGSARRPHEQGRQHHGTDRAHSPGAVSYTHLRAHETDSYLVCRLLLEKKKKTIHLKKIKK